MARISQPRLEACQCGGISPASDPVALMAARPSVLRASGLRVYRAIGFIGFIGFIGLIGCIGLIGLIGFIGL